MRRASLCAAGILAALLPFLAACRRDPPPPPHVLFVTVDALRARNLGCYGYARPTSPSIDRLARVGVLFEQAISVGGNTSAAMPGIFTGRYAFFEYGEPWTDAPFGMERFRKTKRGLGLPYSMTTLAEHLSSAGYRTAGFVANAYLKALFGMEQGFAHHEAIVDDATKHRFLQADRVLERALPYLATVDWSQPTFVYLHFMDTHGPYRTPDRAFLGARRRLRRETFWERWENLAAADPSEHELDLAYATASYDSALRYADEAVGRVIREYENRGLLDRTLVVVTSDHGEEFLEHGGTTHKGTLYEELVHVPLVIRAPGGLRGVRAPQLVRNFDVTPTILDYAGVHNTAGMNARSLRPLLEGRRFDAPEKVYAGFPWIRMMRSERYKLLRMKDGGELFFDLQADPAERTSLADSKDPAVQRERRALAESMDRLVERLRREAVPKDAPPQAVTIDEATRRQLRALGYVQ